MTSAEILLSVVVLAQMAVIYGLINRLLIQAGQPRMRPSKTLSDTSEVFRSQQHQSTAAVEHPKRAVVERVKVGV